VASRVRGSAVVAELHAEGVAEERLAALETPAGLDIGARTPEEIALSILARIVTVRRGEQTLSVRVIAPTAAATPELATAIDPVCGMAVAAVPETPHVDHEGRRIYFCCDGCRSTWTRSHVPQ
jgi:xanthine dehydrogenase accessory factor